MEERRTANKENLRKWRGGMPQPSQRLTWGLVPNALVHKRMVDFESYEVSEA